jgi:putative endonuclease
MDSRGLMQSAYVIVSVFYPDRYYVGLTEDVRQRLARHNQGIVRSTASSRPWHLRTAVCFSSESLYPGASSQASRGLGFRSAAR